MYIVHIVGYFDSCIMMHGFMNVKFMLLVYFGMQLNINCCSCVRNFAMPIVCNLPLCVLVICSAVYFESVMIRLTVIETEE
jgi:hypothetical protein